MKPDITLYFIRHGQTEWNRTRRIQGQIDTPLNDTGRAQAARNGRALAGLSLDLDNLPFIASPLERTRETMEIIREAMGLPRSGYATDDRLKEIHFGAWQGIYWYETATKDPTGHAGRESDPYGWRPDGGESYADLTDRAGQWVEELDRDTICVAHGGISRALRGHILGIDTSEVPELPVPQDKILVLRAGAMEWI
jgi:broad specificity phosphatase PhoE